MESILLERGTLALVDADVRDRLSAAYAELKGTWSASTERSIESDLRHGSNLGTTKVPS